MSDEVTREFAARRIVVTGGSGFIGAHLIRALCSRGAARVVVVDRRPPNERLSALPEAVSHVPYELGAESRAALRAALRGTTDLVHLAAEKHNEAEHRPEDILYANVLGTHTLLEEAARAQVRRVVFASSLYAYGRTAGPPLVESEPANPGTIYGISKLAGERFCAHFAERGGPSWLALRLFFVYGPGQTGPSGYRSVVPRTLLRLRHGERPLIVGDGEQVLDYVHVDDVVEAFLRALSSDADGRVLNVGSGQGTRVRDLVHSIARLAGSALAPEHAPADATAGTCRVANIEAAAAALGWRPRIGLEEGLARTLADPG